MRVFLDANILFSAAQMGSPIRQMLDRLLVEKCVLLTHRYANDEAWRNLVLKRPRWCSGFTHLLGSITITAELAPLPDVDLTEKDRPILRAAVGGSCTHLLTGDSQHFGHLFGHTVAGVRVVSPRLLAGEMRARGWVG